MRTISRYATALLLILTGSLAMADTLELADGTILQGDFVGSSNGIVMFNTGDSVEAYPESQVVGIFLSDGVATAQSMAAAPPTPSYSVPAGTKVLIRMVDTVDSKRHSARHKFRGQLEGALVANGVTVAPRGTFLYGTVTAGRLAGKPVVAMAFMDIMIDDQL